MYATRIDRKLSAMELHKALIYANGAFQEYLGLLHALVLSNCVDGADNQQHLFEVPMVFRARKTKLSESKEDLLKASKGHLIHLDDLGIEPDAYFRANSFYLLKPTDGLAMLPLRLLELGFQLRVDHVRCYAIKISTPPDFLKVPSFDHMPFRHRPVDDVRAVKTPDEIPEGFVVAPEIIVPSSEYFYWLQTLEEILCYRLTPLQPLFPLPISPPVFTHASIVFPNGDGIYLPRLNVFKDEFAEDELPLFSDVAKPLLVFESQVRSTLALVAQEVNRRLAREHSQADAVMSFDNQATPSASQFDPATMITISELVAEASKQLGHTITDTWVYNALEKEGIGASYEPEQKNKPKGYPRIASLGAITKKVQSK